MTASRRKEADWSRVYTYDFGDFEEFDGGDCTITTATVTATPSGLTIGTPLIGTGDDSCKVQARISGGEAGEHYVTTCTIVSSGDDTLSQKGIIPVT